MTKAYMLDTEERAEAKYKKWEKEPAPFGWDVFNQKTLYNAYKKRTKNIDIDIENYNKMKEADPEFYREASSLQYGKAPKISEDRVEMMVKDLKDRDQKLKSFSRRRRFHEEKDIDSINDVMSISIRKLSEPSGNTCWRSRIILREELLYPIKIPFKVPACIPDTFQSGR
ncbi:hypothetical protein U1Q18_019081 [Sarracenia purpurea var. burkii]